MAGFIFRKSFIDSRLQNGSELRLEYIRTLIRNKSVYCGADVDTEIKFFEFFFTGVHRRHGQTSLPDTMRMLDLGRMTAFRGEKEECEGRRNFFSQNTNFFVDGTKLFV
jgi:hypothetical protein